MFDEGEGVAKRVFRGTFDVVAGAVPVHVAFLFEGQGLASG